MRLRGGQKNRVKLFFLLVHLILKKASQLFSLLSVHSLFFVAKHDYFPLFAFFYSFGFLYLEVSFFEFFFHLVNRLWDLPRSSLLNLKEEEGVSSEIETWTWWSSCCCCCCCRLLRRSRTENMWERRKLISGLPLRTTYPSSSSKLRQHFFLSLQMLLAQRHKLFLLNTLIRKKVTLFVHLTSEFVRFFFNLNMNGHCSRWILFTVSSARHCLVSEWVSVFGLTPDVWQGVP